MTSLVLTAANWLNLDGLAELLRDWKRAKARKAMYRQTRRELSQLTDYELRDLGIGRSDIESIARGTFHDDRITNVQTNPNLKGFV
tara:strand:- start:1049 stop:1306 length:258 start_codon:yes stop_codon:yes gene_type:complete